MKKDNYFAEKEAYFLDINEGSIKPFSKRKGKSNIPVKYEKWFQKMIDKKVCSFDVPKFREFMEFSKLKTLIKKDFFFEFRVHKESGNEWMAVYHYAFQGESILVIKSIHEEMKWRSIQKRNKFYLWMRRRMGRMESMEKEYGVVVLEAQETGYELRYISTPLRKALSGYYNKEVYKHQKQVEDFIERMLTGQKERCESEIEYMRIRMENDSTCWIQLYGKAFDTVSGRKFLYLMVTNAYDYRDKEGLQELKDYVEHYIFEWNIEEDTVEVSGIWEKKFVAAGEEIHKGHEIEKYIYPNDLLKFQKISNLVLSGESQEDILLRFYVKNQPKEYSWCTVSFISVLYDKNVPMFAIGRVKDIDNEISRVMGIPDQESGEARIERDEAVYIETVIETSTKEQQHALIAIEFKIWSRRSSDRGKEIQKDIIWKKWVEKFSEVLCPSDSLLLEGEILYVFLHNIDRKNSEIKAVRISRFLEAMGEGTISTKVGLVMWPKSGHTLDELKLKVYEALKNEPIRMQDYATSAGERQIDEHKEGYSQKKLTDLIDEWYTSVKINKQLQDQMDFVESQLLLSQIRPHFIYNVLANIKALIYKDKDRAGELVVRFSRYLRTNLENIGKEEAAPFPEILAVLRNYIELEKYRFEDKIIYREEVGYSDFYFPFFILQPLAENAIRHGICKKDRQGTLVIKTYEEDGTIHILIQDDGVGFKVGSDGKGRERYGIGIKNVELRLKYLVEGKMRIETEVGKGTTVELLIPKYANRVVKTQREMQGAEKDENSNCR